MLTKASVGLGRVQLQTPENSNHQDGQPPTLCCNFVIHNSQGSYEILYSENSLGTVLHDRMKKKKGQCWAVCFRAAPPTQQTTVCFCKNTTSNSPPCRKQETSLAKKANITFTGRQKKKLKVSLQSWSSSLKQ